MKKIKLPEPAKAIPYYPRGEKKMTLKKSYSIELTEEQEYALKLRFGCQTDRDLRYALQEAIIRIISYDQATRKELDDLTSMRQSSRLPNTTKK